MSTPAIRRLPLITAVLSCAACSGTEPHAVLVVEDPFGLAANSTGIAVGERLDSLVLLDRGGADFPLTLKVTAEDPIDLAGVWVEARARSGPALARGRVNARLQSDSQSFRVSLGHACEAVGQIGVECALESDDSDLTGVCVAGSCVLPSCGDGVVRAPEECDDGNDDDGDRCTNQCRLAVCGDGIVNSFDEECDDGNNVDEDACLTTCAFNTCGDQILNPEAEACDDGNVNPNDGCNGCQVPSWDPSFIGGRSLPGAIRSGNASLEMCLMELASVDYRDDELFLTDRRANLVYRVDLIRNVVTLAAGQAQTLPRTGSDALNGRRLLDPRGTAVDDEGALYVADAQAHVVYRIDPLSGRMTSFAGDGTEGDSGDDGPAANARLRAPVDVAIDTSGDILIVDQGAHRIRRVDAVSGRIATVAGTGACSSLGNDGPAVLGGLCDPVAIAVGVDGGLYVAEQQQHRVRLIEPTGILRVYAGNGNQGSGGDGGAALQAEMDTPTDLAIDPDGVLFVSEAERVRRIDEGRRVSTFLTSGPGRPTFQPGPLTFDNGALDVFDASIGVVQSFTASIAVPTPLVGSFGCQSLDATLSVDTHSLGRMSSIVDVAGELWAVAPELGRVYRVDESEFVSVLGTGVPGGGPAAFAEPIDVALDGASRPLVVDRGVNRLYRVETDDTLTVLAGGSPSGPIGDGASAVDSVLSAPSAVAVNDAGDIYIADSAHFRVRRISGGVIETVLGTGTETVPQSAASGEGTSYGIGEVTDLEVLADDSLLVADASNGAILRLTGTSVQRVWLDSLAEVRRMFSSDGTTAGVYWSAVYEGAQTRGALFFDLDDPEIFAGEASSQPASAPFVRGVGAPASDVAIRRPEAIAIDAMGRLVFSELNPPSLWRFEGELGVLSRVSGEPPAPRATFVDSRIGAPSAIVRVGVQDEGGWYLTDDLDDGYLYRLLDGEAALAAVAGAEDGVSEAAPGYEDAALTRAFARAQGVAWDEDEGAIYVSEANAHIVRRVQVVDTADPTTWTVSVLVGEPFSSGAVDGPATSARLNQPTALLLLPEERALLISDTRNHAIRRVDLAGASLDVTTFAGILTRPGFSGESAQAAAALLRRPRDLALAVDGGVYIADQGNNRVRHVDPVGIIRTVTGDGRPTTSGDGSIAAEAPFAEPKGLAVDSFGNLFVAGRGFVRVVAAGGDGFAFSNDEVRLIYGDETELDYPARVTPCLTDIELTPNQAALWITDSCQGVVVALERN